MVPLYETLVADSVLDLDRALLDSMRAKIHDELANLDEKWLSLPLYLPCLWTLIRDFGLTHRLSRDVFFFFLIKQIYFISI